ncbi:prepilin-type N-terminal cleavage/methylation domain-containing protein [Nitrogeniibacter mangrovi]|uniref:Prepilin-type N-terminal cleavage/methylation domain-containing protein n=1 Tax=Nitrogeniibacter mangrovi TaxID=2016596 RepID=A0A6C1BAI1_9RHOO|nr:prepilin-type N-terminal cleavage/methylation domain-containing protein [Nitrogeniibacter mangrovi]QID19390.1 prepilin-type N-terminal cleavage/methylation domain-containing protein [Nitrogeniibacter mangrovi]
MPTLASSNPTERGTTLLELLVVVALLGLLAWVGLGANLLPPPERRVERALIAELSSARSTSVKRGTVATVDCSVLPAKIETAGARTADLTIECFPQFGAGSKRFSFYPDGSTSGGFIRFGFGHPDTIVLVDWLTGAIHVLPREASAP